ncbi:MAG: UDP-N-acetylmuramate dehydrogenase [Oceanospirillaceae bacterium]|jgi:UDP-N-acetylmuramate dehydrogenase|nr:UDP-N-acetylmuramate dehydrogenase [Oceanospirillaceae bacterium]MBT6076491.1 UDP-N-acetylmuramate dehydrogenase [Oceanospirillaceae bacterium]
MIKPQKNVSLKAYNTLGIDVQAAFFMLINNPQDLHDARDFCRLQGCPWLLIGGGSNLVLTQDFVGLVMLMAMSKLDWTSHTDGLEVCAESGCEWDALVAESVTRGASGLENLSLIPGQVGAAPIQNIGAYGVEVKQSLRWVDVFDFNTGSCFKLTAKACEFGYRDSIFKRQPHWIVMRVNLQLGHRVAGNKPAQLSYGIIAHTIESMTGQPPEAATGQQIRDAVIHIRQSKLPDPKQLPNVGSFFKNPIVSAHQTAKIEQQWPELVAYKLEEGGFKLAAGWLIDQLGWKGYSQDGVGVHQLQALVLVATGAAVTGGEVLALAQRIQADVLARFDVVLDIEPRLFDSRGEFWLS